MDEVNGLMPGRVFISCGQHSVEERESAQKVKQLLSEEFGLDPYVAATIQTLSDVMSIAEELRRADYFLFIDFLRLTGPTNPFPISLFSHQELALAYHLGFKDNAIFLQQNDAPREGFLKYILGNAEPFATKTELLEGVRRLVNERAWTRDFSRNLTVGRLNGPVRGSYRAHTTVQSEVHDVWELTVHNRRSDSPAVRTACVLAEILEGDSSNPNHRDRSHLKWSGQAAYHATILPGDFAVLDAFAVHEGTLGVLLHSQQDICQPIIRTSGNYTLLLHALCRKLPAG